VDDTGLGVTAMQRERLFELFYQAEEDAARLAGGLGIGLTLTRHIVEAHAGKIWLEAKPTAGLRVCFSLPLAGPPVSELESS
jgi:signal transduction histidine kinase